MATIDDAAAGPPSEDDDSPLGVARRARPHEPMPRWVPRAIALFFLVYVAVITGGILLDTLRTLLIMLLVSLFLSFAIEPAVNRLARRGFRRGAATGLMFLFVLGLAGLFFYAIGSLVADQIQKFADEAPGYVDEIVKFSNEHFNTDLNGDELRAELTDPNGAFRGFAENVANDVVDLSLTVVSLLFQMFTVGLFTFYLVADGPRLRRSICSMLPAARQREVLRAWELAIDKTGGYIYSRALLAVLSGVAHWILMASLGIPFALALALWVGVISQFVPVVGTYIAGALPILIALLNEPVTALWLVIFVFAYQQLENYLFAPRVTAHTLEIHPAVAFGSAIAGAAILGPVGAVLALPAAAVFQAFLGTYIRRHEVVDTPLTTEFIKRRKRPPATPAVDPPDA
jgi:predicted PurR-regulated permease PerM